MLPTTRKTTSPPEGRWQLMRRRLPALFVGLIVSSLIIFVLWLNITDTLPIHTIKIYGPWQNLAQDDVRIALGDMRRGFFHLNVIQVQTKLLQLPWVNAASVARQWPDTIVITLTEQQPAAIFNGEQLFNASGKLFTPALASFPANLPMVWGPVAQADVIWRNYQTWQQLLSTQALQIAQLQVNDRGSWQLQLTQGMKIILGREQLLSRLQQFVSAYPQLQTRMQGIITQVDLRYPDGLAVKVL